VARAGNGELAREVGGTELPAVLRALAAALRQDAAVRAEVEARQSWVVNAARLGVAAPWVVLVLLASRPEGAAAYNSPAGRALLGTGAAVTVLAYRIMVALGRLPEERRWFS
jgi:tight adherence protein B